MTHIQRTRLLRSFDLRQPTGQRDYAMTLLMVDLGLRIGEVVWLQLDDVDWKRRLLSVPAIKTLRRRTVPLPGHN
jgi:integrase